jgi:hypothetical protein
LQSTHHLQYIFCNSICMIHIMCMILVMQY